MVSTVRPEPIAAPKPTPTQPEELPIRPLCHPDSRGEFPQICGQQIEP
jgi:hypothetical protein